jgi:hypothetical protein
VVIGIRESQAASDQFICLVFEMLNSEGEKRFSELERAAQAGKISRTDFAREMIRQEFQAVKRTQKLLQTLKLGKVEFVGSGYYRGFIECPDSFEVFLKYTSGGARDEMKEYEQEYDWLRKKQQRSNTTPEPTATATSDSTKP